MKKLLIALTLITSLPAWAECTGGTCGTALSMPEIDLTNLKGFTKKSNVAQYKFADWKNLIGIAHEVSLREAVDYADSNDEVTFFFYVKCYRMVLETQDGSYRTFRQGDAVFFSGTPWWGSAPGMADGYIKE